MREPYTAARRRTISLDARYWDRDFETRPWSWIESWQAQQLASMLESLPQRSELYRDLLAGAGQRVGLRGYWVTRGGRLPSLDMLERVPFTTKDDLRAGQRECPPGRPLGSQQAVPRQYVVQVVSSAGTTGRPVFAGLTRRDQVTWADTTALGFWTAGIRPDDIVAHLGDPPGAAGGWPYADGLRRLGATVVWLGGLPSEETLTRLAALQATVVLTTTGAGIEVIREAGDAERPRDLGLQRVVVGGEPGLADPDVRGDLAEGWGVAHVRDTMGVAEVMASLWSECDDAGGMHFNAGRSVIIELVDPDTGTRVPWREGATGEAVYTTFDRDATPVLRYRSGDRVEVTGLRCACGRTAPKVRCLGRTDEAAAGEDDAEAAVAAAIREVVLRRFGDVLAPSVRVWLTPAGRGPDDPLPLEVETREDVPADQHVVLAERIGKTVRDELRLAVVPVLRSPGTMTRGVAAGRPAQSNGSKRSADR